MVRKMMVVVMVVCMAVPLSMAASKGTSGAQFLKIVSAPRPSAMGSTFAAIAGDANSIAFNPAGLAYIEKTEIVLVQNSWIQDISNQYVAVGMPVGKAGAFGLGVDMVSVKDIDKVNNSQVAQGSYDATDMAITIGYARELSNKVGLGLNVKHISSKIDTESASSIAADIGGLYRISPKVDLGLAIQNVGQEIKFINEGDPLPMTIKAGGAYKLNDALLLGLDVSKPNDSDLYVGVGGEYCLTAGEKLMFPLRLGYRTGMETGGLSGLGVGGGLVYNNVLGVDLAWTPVGDLGDSIKFGMRVLF